MKLGYRWGCFFLWLSAISIAANLACGTGNRSDLPKILSTSIDTSAGPIYRSLKVALSSPASVQVKYTDNATGQTLTVNQDVAATDSIPLPRLHADSSYTYTLQVIEAAVAGDSAQGQFTTGSLPADLAAIPFTTTGTPTVPLVMLQLRGTFKGVAAVDGAGKVVWYYRTQGNPQGADRRANGNWVVVDTGNRLVEVDWKGTAVHTLPQQSGFEMHHDVVATPQNTVYYLTREIRNINGTNYTGEVIWEWDPDHNGSPVRRWAAFDFLNPATDIGIRSVPSDWFHANSLRIGPRNNIILSFHFFDQLNSIKSDFSGFEWRLGGPGSTFTLPPEAFFSGQHSAKEIATDDLVLFDNGYARPDGGTWSRALELTLDQTSKAASIKWQYRPSPDIWSWTISSARRLKSGNTLVTFGDPTKSATIQVHEVTPSSVAIWKMIVGGDVASIFRGEPMDSIRGEY